MDELIILLDVILTTINVNKLKMKTESKNASLYLLIFLHFFSFTLHTIYQRRILAVLDIIQKVGVVVISGRKSGEAAGLMNEDVTVTSPVYKTYRRGEKT